MVSVSARVPRRCPSGKRSQTHSQSQSQSQSQSWSCCSVSQSLSLGFIDWCDSGFSYFYFDSHLLFWSFCCCCCCCCTRLAVSLFFSPVCLSFLNFYHIFGYAAGQTGCRCRSNVQRKWCGRCSTLDCFLAVAIAVYIRFWLDLCHLINQTNTARKPKPREGREEGEQGRAGQGGASEACVVCSSLRQLQPDPNTHKYRDKYVCV